MAVSTFVFQPLAAQEEDRSDMEGTDHHDDCVLHRAIVGWQTGLTGNYFGLAEPLRVIASEAKQSILSFCALMDCFAALAMTALAGIFFQNIRLVSLWVSTLRFI